MYKGACLCGGVGYEIAGPLAPITACHCSQCRQWSGHLWASAKAAREHFRLVKGEDRVRWYPSSSFAERGFCTTCGSTLFWPMDEPFISVSAGTLAEPHDLTLARHIFCASKGAYYEIADDLPQYEEDD